MKKTMSSSGPNRRDLLKVTGLAAGAGALGLVQSTHAESTQSGKSKITVAGYKYDRVLPIADGRVGIDGFEVRYEPDRIGNLNTHIFAGPGTRQVTEVGLHPFILAYANKGFSNYSLLPIFPLKTFRHKSIFIRTDRGIKKPQDLKGRKVGTPGFSSTSLTWLRGIMEHEYGLKPTDVEWVVSAKDSGSDTAGSVSEFENVIPDGLSVSTGTPGKDESELLLDGEVDALFHALEPKAFVEGNPIVGRMFPEFQLTEQEYYKKTGIFPIMHAVAIHNDFAKKHPELPLAVCRAYSESKRLALAELRKLGWANISLPWIAKEIENTRKVMGDDFWSYGLKNNEKTLNTLFKYSHEQGLAKKLVTIEDLFHPAAMEFEEK